MSGQNAHHAAPPTALHTTCRAVRPWRVSMAGGVGKPLADSAGSPACAGSRRSTSGRGLARWSCSRVTARSSDREMPKRWCGRADLTVVTSSAVEPRGSVRRAVELGAAVRHLPPVHRHPRGLRRGAPGSVRAIRQHAGRGQSGRPLRDGLLGGPHRHLAGRAGRYAYPLAEVHRRGDRGVSPRNRGFVSGPSGWWPSPSCS